MINKQELSEIRMKLYKPSSVKLQLVDELIDTIKHCFNGVETTEVTFNSNLIVKFDTLIVKSVEIDPQEIGGVLIHWQPNYKVSTKSDPYCSAYILTPKEIRKLIKTIEIIHNNYIQ